MSDEFGFESGFEAESFPGELLGEESEQEEEYRRRGFSRAPRSYRPAPRRHSQVRRWSPPRPSYSRPYPRPRPWPPRYRWPTIAWPAPQYPLAVPSFDAGSDAPPVEEPPPPDASPDAAADAGPDQDAGGGDQELLSNVFGRVKSGIGSAVAKVGDALAGPSRIVDLTARADRSLRRPRDPKTVYALVLHQMACCFKPRDPLTRFLKLHAHYAILPDGRILQIHPVSANVAASNNFNACSVAVEFAGNFPDVRGRWWQGEKFGRNQPTSQQLDSGRWLIRHLMRTIGLTHVLAHRQASASRSNDPGPEIWYHVGQWAIDNLGLKDGGASFKVGTGTLIPQEWRTWGRRSVARETSFDREAMQSETEIAHDELTMAELESETESGEASFGETSFGEASFGEVPFGEAESGETELGETPEAEVTEAVRQAAARLPATQRPVYRNVGRLANAINNANVNGPGLYLIMFNVGNQLKGYHGMAADRRRRLIQHRLGAQRLGLSIDNHRVLVADVPQARLRPTELAINTFLLNNHRQHFTNQRGELELGEATALPGETWA